MKKILNGCAHADVNHFTADRRWSGAGADEALVMQCRLSSTVTPISWNLPAFRPVGVRRVADRLWVLQQGG